MTTTLNVEHNTAVIEASLAAAWLRRCGPTGTPGDWMIPGEFVEITEVGNVEVTIYPLWCQGDVGRRSWSSSFNPGESEPAWEWRLNCGWDDCTKAEVEAIIELDGCFDDRQVSWLVEGSHDEKPPIPPEMVQAFTLLTTAPER